MKLVLLIAYLCAFTITYAGDICVKDSGCDQEMSHHCEHQEDKSSNIPDCKIECCCLTVDQNVYLFKQELLKISFIRDISFCYIETTPFVVLIPPLRPPIA